MNFLTNVSKSFGDKKALDNVSVEIGEREFVSIIGPNASGKSTLLKILAGIIPATSGEVRTGDTAYMPQDHSLLPWRTVEENLLLPADIRGDREKSRTPAKELLNEFGVEQYADKYPAALSGGTRQKIALLRTVLQNAELLLLDEPFAPLDALSRLEAQKWLIKLTEKTKAATLLVTHDIREAILLSDKLYVLRAGRVVETIRVSLPIPRRHEHLSLPAAVELEKKLLSLLV